MYDPWAYTYVTRKLTNDYMHEYIVWSSWLHDVDIVLWGKV